MPDNIHILTVHFVSSAFPVLSHWVDPPGNHADFQTSIEPLLHSDARITYHGLVDHATLFQALSQAQAVLFPMKWDEPFGYVIAEAMAVGTPVILYDRGAARE